MGDIRGWMVGIVQDPCAQLSDRIFSRCNFYSTNSAFLCRSRIPFFRLLVSQLSIRLFAAPLPSPRVAMISSLICPALFYADPLVSLLSAHEAPVQGSVYVTSFRLIFRPAAADQAHALISLPLGIIEKVDKVKAFEKKGGRGAEKWGCSKRRRWVRKG